MGPGTPGDSCFGTCYTPATATKIRGKNHWSRDPSKGCKILDICALCWIPHSGQQGEGATKQLERCFPPRTATLAQRPRASLRASRAPEREGLWEQCGGACWVSRRFGGTLVAWCCLPHTWQNLQRRQHQFSSWSSRGRSLSSKQNLWKGSQQT